MGLDVPLFSRNQGGIGRADAEVEASRQYAAVRAQVVSDVRSAAVRVQQAEQAISAWREEIVPSLEVEQRQAESAYQAGEIPLFMLLEVSRRLVDGRVRGARRRGRPAAGDDRARTQYRPVVRPSLRISSSCRSCCLVVLAVLITGCSRSGPRPPMKVLRVSSIRTEAELSTIKLTAEAVKRLGIETVTVRTDSAAATRTLGAEIVVPEGRSVVVTAPVAGTTGGGGLAGRRPSPSG